MSYVVHSVLDEGELETISVSGQIKDVLNSDMVALIVDEEKKQIWIWKGETARVRRKFIAARKSQDLRGELGLSFRVDSIDQGSEPNEFINLIGGPVSKAPEISEFVPTEQPVAPKPVAKPMKTSKPASTIQPVQKPPTIQEPPQIKPQPKAKPQPKPKVTKPTPKITQPIPTIEPISISTPTSEISEISSSIQNLPVEDSVKQIIAIIDQKEIPPNYEREIVVIGPYVFSIIESKKTFLGQEKIEHKWDLFSDLPEGDFLAKDYTARMIVNEGRIMAVEFLKSTTETVQPRAEIVSFKIKFNK